MQHESDIEEWYLQVRRLVCAICLANNDLSHEERIVLASSVGGASNLTNNQMKTLVNDASESPDVRVLASSIHHPAAVRQFLVDLAALAVVKGDWHDSEEQAAHEAIRSLSVPEEVRHAALRAFDELKRATILLCEAAT